MTGWWDPMPDAQRRRWELLPHVGVGPLRFGMSPDQVEAALDGARPGARIPNRDASLHTHHYDSRDFGVTLYYDDTKRLFGIALDARRGPQVVADGMALVGRVPSELERWLADRAEAREAFTELFYTCGGEQSSASLGVVVGLQRSGDRLLTRPVFLPAWAWDDLTGTVPSEVWAIRS